MASLGAPHWHSRDISPARITRSRRVMLCSNLAGQRHDIIRYGSSLAGEESVSGGHRRHPAGSIRRTHACVSASSAMMESRCGGGRRCQSVRAGLQWLPPLIHGRGQRVSCCPLQHSSLVSNLCRPTSIENVSIVTLNRVHGRGIRVAVQEEFRHQTVLRSVVRRIKRQNLTRIESPIP